MLFGGVGDRSMRKTICPGADCHDLGWVYPIGNGGSPKYPSGALSRLAHFSGADAASSKQLLL